MFSGAFIKRPRLAMVVSLVILLAGALCVFKLPVSEYPIIAPPTVMVMGFYPGASAQEVADTVAAPIESEVNSVQDLIYYSSTSDNSGNYTLNITFKPGVDEDMALVNVNSAVKLAEHSLPQEVVANGLVVVKRTADILCAISVHATDPETTLIDVSNFADIHLKDALARIDGVGYVVIFGEMKYSMRVWLDPEKMRSLGISAGEIRGAISSQNIQAAAGSIGSEYSGNLMQFKVDSQGRLKTPEEFGEIVVRSGAGGMRQVLLKDIAKIELGSEKYEGTGRYNGDESVTLAIFKLNNGNALDIMDKIRAELASAEKHKPEGIEWEISYDTTRFVKASMHEIVETLVMTFILVVFITWLFLQSWRATLIPAVAIPVSLVGTFLFMQLIGLSINTLTMFALILVIGSVVDDAIVVVESVMRMIVEEYKTPWRAAWDTMKQISGALIATTLVVVAVYAPIAFAEGMVGTIYLQFSATMCIALLISLLNALTLSPALAALVLRRPREPRGPFKAFNWGLAKVRRFYEMVSGWLIRHMAITLLAFAGVLFADWWLFTHAQPAFIPEEDKGTLFVETLLPPGSALSRTEKVLGEVAKRCSALPEVLTISEVPGHSLTAGDGENVSFLIIELKDWSERRGKGQDAWSLQRKVMDMTADIPDANVLALVPPAIQGLGEAGGVAFELQATGKQTYEDLGRAANELIGRLMQSGKVMYAFTSFDYNTPMLHFAPDRAKAEAMGIPVSDVFMALQTQLGSMYVNDFNLYGKTYQVKMQADRLSRASAESLNSIYVTSKTGAQVPLSAIGEFTWTTGSRQAERFNMFMAAGMNAQSLPGTSSGELIKLIESTVDEMGADWQVSFKDMAYQEKQNEGQIVWLLILSLVMAYLFLVGQYESWMVPISVILSISTAVAGGLLALRLSGMAMNIYCQLGLLMLIGLTAKTAILMVEYAKQRRESSVGIYRAAITGLRMRFRSVQMTALSFVIGVLPLLYATGAGANARKAVGVSTFWGMLVATVLGMMLVPALYVFFQRIGEAIMGPPKKPEEDDEEL